MAPKSIDETVERMRAGTEVSFQDLDRVCRHYFGPPRIKGSHHVFKMPWPGDPRINIQNARGKAKAYQVKQVLRALERLADEATAKIASDATKEKAAKPRKK